MDSSALEQTLRDLPSVGTLIKGRKYRQVWRFEFNGKAFYLKFYPRDRAYVSRDWWRRRFRGSPAANEFHRLQWLQKAKIPAPRAIAYLAGFTLSGVKGDAVILQAIEPSVSLDQLLNDQALAGDYPAKERRKLADQLIDLVFQLGKAGYGHDDLHLGNFLLHEGQLYLIDAYDVRKGGLKTADVLWLGASVARFAPATDIVRAWRKLVGPDVPLPSAIEAGQRVWDNQMERVMGDNPYVGRVTAGEWEGVFFRRTKYPRRWSPASTLNVTDDDWRSAFPLLLKQMGCRETELLKESPSGDVHGATIRLGGRDVDVIIKRPKRRYLYRYVNEIGRGSRGYRAWVKAWHLVVRDLPTAWPLAMFERRRFGYPLESVFIAERVPGPTLWKVDLDALTKTSRENVFRRTGRLLRLLERFGFSHFDAKASNWIVRADEKVGPSPVMIDVDGIRRRRVLAFGIRRLLRSLVDRKQYSREDSRNLCLGYAPRTRLEEPPAEPAAQTEPAGEGI